MADWFEIVYCNSGFCAVFAYFYKVVDVFGLNINT